MTTKILVMGEALIDAVSDGSGPVVEHVGGSPANVAFGLGALDHLTELATHIGDDSRGQAIAETCRARGVTLVPGSVTERSTSVAHATLDERGAASYVFDIAWHLPALAEDAGYGHVHTGSIGATLLPGADDVLATVRSLRATATISYDPNARPSLMGSPDEVRERMEELISCCDVVKASDEDIAWLYPDGHIPDVLRRWGTLGAQLMVVTRGVEGAVVVHRSGQGTSLPAGDVAVVDTVGAGDSFMAGLISGLIDAGLLGSPEARERLAGATLTEIKPAIERALRTAGVTVSKAGAYAPGRSEIGAPGSSDAGPAASS